MSLFNKKTIRVRSKQSSNFGHQRPLFQKVKTARGRKNSSTRWLQRQLNDPYVHQAQQFGYKSRAAFKLIELNQKFNFLKKNHLVVDLGAAPGGWSQVCQQHQCRTIGIDLFVYDPIPGALSLTHDFTSPEGYAALDQALQGESIHVLLSDLASPSIGHPPTDHLRTLALLEFAWDFAEKKLSPHGTFVCKVFQGGAQQDILKKIQSQFQSVRHFKPPASRKESRETYIVAQNFTPKVSL